MAIEILLPGGISTPDLGIRNIHTRAKPRPHLLIDTPEMLIALPDHDIETLRQLPVVQVSCLELRVGECLSKPGVYQLIGGHTVVVSKRPVARGSVFVFTTYVTINAGGVQSFMDAWAMVKNGGLSDVAVSAEMCESFQGEGK